MTRDNTPRIPSTVGVPLLVGVILAGTLSVLDSTLVVPLLSTIGAEFGSGTEVSWLVAAYLVASTVTIPLWGRWLDLRGERSPTWTALAVFAAGTVIAMLAPNLSVLIIGRAIQGFGAGGLVPLGQAILAGRCTTPERARLQVYYNIAYGAAAGLGPLVGGALVDVSWRWAFAIILPFTVIAGVMLMGRLRATPVNPHVEPFDGLGAFVLTAGLIVLLIGIERTSAWIIVLGVALMGGFTWLSHRSPHALIPWRVLGKHIVLIASGVALIVGLLQFAMLTYLPMLAARAAPDMNPGLVVIPLTLLWMTLGAFTGVLALRIGTKVVVVIGVLCALASTVTVAWSTALPALFLASVLIGASAGFVLIPTLLITQHSVAKADIGSMTSLMVLIRNFGGAAGAALTAVLLASHSVRETFVILAIVAALALLPALRLPGRGMEN